MTNPRALELARKIETECVMTAANFKNGLLDYEGFRTHKAAEIIAAALAERDAEIERLRGGVVGEVATERQRQKEVEGWTTEHDDSHREGQMATAAACYALGDTDIKDPVDGGLINIWPWDIVWWKPKDRRRDLVRAAALIVAEIERLDRATHKGSLTNA